MKNILCILSLAGTLAAQAQMPVNDLLRHAPADADQVIDVNLGAISSKIDLPSIFTLLESKSKNDKKMAMMRHLLAADIDFHQHILLASSKDSAKHFTVIAHITDSAKFVAALRAMVKDAADGAPLHFVHLPGKERVAVHKDFAAAWTDRLAVITSIEATETSKETGHPIASTQLKAARRAAAGLQGFSNTKFLTDGHFTTAFSDDGDIHIWSKHSQWASLANKFGKLSPGMAQLGMLSQMAGQNNGAAESIATVRFDNGSISYSTLKFSSAAQIAAAQRSLGQGLNSELLAIVPPRQLIGVVSLHIDMTAVEDSIKKIPSFAMLDTMMQGKGIHVMDIVHALKGDFMLLVCHPDKPAATDSNGKKKMPSPTLYLVASITNKSAFEKIVPMIKLQDAMTAGADTATTDTAHPKNPFPYYVVQNDLVVLGKRHHAAEFFTPGASGEPVGKLLTEDLTRTNTLNAVLDFHTLVGGILAPTVTTTADEPSKEKALMDMLQNLQTFQVSVGAVHGDAIETRISFNFTDKSKNSLAVLINMLGALSQK